MGRVARGYCLALIAATTAAPGCATESLTVTPQEIHRHLADLRDKGAAEVEVDPSGKYRLTKDKVFHAHFPGEMRYLTVAQLMANCTEIVPYPGQGRHRTPPCLLEETTSEAWEVDTRTQGSLGTFGSIAGFTLGIGVVTGVGYCLYECEGTLRYVSIGVSLAALLAITPIWLLFNRRS